jgi:hypothetical protein
MVELNVSDRTQVLTELFQCQQEDTASDWDRNSGTSNASSSSQQSISSSNMNVLDDENATLSLTTDSRPAWRKTKRKVAKRSCFLTVNDPLVLGNPNYDLSPSIGKYDSPETSTTIHSRKHESSCKSHVTPDSKKTVSILKSRKSMVRFQSRGSVTASIPDLNSDDDNMHRQRKRVRHHSQLASSDLDCEYGENDHYFATTGSRTNSLMDDSYQSSSTVEQSTQVSTDENLNLSKKIIEFVGIGSRISVYWPLDHTSYVAEVWEKENTSVFLRYIDDGVTEWIDLTKHQFELLR